MIISMRLTTAVIQESQTSLALCVHQLSSRDNILQLKKRSSRPTTLTTGMIESNSIAHSASKTVARRRLWYVISTDSNSESSRHLLARQSSHTTSLRLTAPNLRTSIRESRSQTRSDLLPSRSTLFRPVPALLQ